MTHGDLILIVHEVLCFGLLYSVFCRALPSTLRVRLGVRLAFFGLGIAACTGMAAPLVWGFLPDAFDLLLLGAVTVVQLVTARYWSAGVPDCFYKAGQAPRRRRADDLQGVTR